MKRDDLRPGQRLRILNVVRSLDPRSGGPAEGLRQMCLATQRLGHQQEVLTLDEPNGPWLKDFPAPVFALGPALGQFGYSPALLPWLRSGAANYDAVVVHGLWQYQGLATWRALRHTGRPYFVYPHGMLDPWFKKRYPLKHLKKQLYWRGVERHVLRDASAVLFTTQEESRLAAQSFAPYAVRPLTAGYGLALDENALSATAEDFSTAFPHLRGRRFLLFMARLHAKKGCDLLIQAFGQLAGAHPDLHLVLAGPDEEGLRPALEALATRCGVAARITWTGMLQGKQKWGALRAAEAFVLPSHQENFGIAVAEALAVGLPVLLSDQVNIWHEVVQHGAGLAGPDTLAGTRETLQRWLSMTPAVRQQMAQRAVSCFQTHFHIDAVAQAFLQIVASHRVEPANSRP